VRSPNSVRLRLMLVVGIALAPLAIASIVQAILNFRAYQRETDRILRQTSLYAAYSEQNVFVRVEQLLRGFARHPEKTATPSSCYTELSDALVGANPIINLTRVDGNGQIVCMGAIPLGKTIQTRIYWWDALRKTDDIIFYNQVDSRILGKTVMPIAVPFHGKDGSFAGAISAAIDLNWLESTPQLNKLPDGTLSMIIGSDGRVLAANHAPPAGISQAVANNAGHQKIFSVKTSEGKRWRWVAERIGNSDKFVAFGVPEPRLLGNFTGYLLADVLLTLLIVTATVLAIWLGTEWLVIRWTLYLKRVAIAYGRNHFTLSLDDLKSAPNEFRLLGREMKRMAIAIQERDRNLSLALERQFDMTREIHHRIKNNLQIVSSLITLYSQNLADPAAQMAFNQITVRVNALTLLQRQIEKSDTNPAVDMPRLFSLLAEQLRELATEHGQSLIIEIKAESQWLSPDIATPLMLFVIEAISYDIFSRCDESKRRDVCLTLVADGKNYTLTIEEQNNHAYPGENSLSGRILRSLTDQLRGQYTTDIHADRMNLVLQIPAGMSPKPRSGTSN